MYLTSNDSAYSARMEKGGLALYLNSNFTQLQHPAGAAAAAAAYWGFPFFRDADPKFPNPNINQLVTSAPIYKNCSNNILSAQYSSPIYLHVSTKQLHKGQTPSSLYMYLELAASCVSGSLGIQTYCFFVHPAPTIPPDHDQSAWSFLRMETDGRLYLYIAVSNSSSNVHVSRYGLDADEVYMDVLSANGALDADRGYFIGRPVFMQDVGTECDVPLACGPLGVCIPGVRNTCSCPNQLYFEASNITDLSQGCKRHTNLPGCSTSTLSRGNNLLMANSTTFVELNSTANIFLLNGATSSNWTGADIDACKHACSLDCSCLGVSYQFSTSSCFLITQEISLLTMSDTINFTSWNYTATSEESLTVDSTANYARDYVTHLKVALLPVDNISGSGFIVRSESSPFPTMSLIGILPSSVIACFLLGLGTWYWWRRRRSLLQHAKEEEALRDILPLLPTRFSYKHLHEATKGFTKLLGAGGCGSVYAGTLVDGRKVALKVLEGAFQGAHSQCKDFLAELATVGRTGHHNIVRLVGFCWQVSRRLLVYEYMERGSLDHWLFGVNDILLDWEKRYNVVLGVARGLHYLHEECEQPILHFDIKPQNILLDNEFVPKLADFGMSRLMQRDMSSVMTGVRGTPGYIAPEWFSHGTVSKKSDIYSMGVVMLEIVAGRKVVDYSLINSSRPENVESEVWHLPSWAAKRWEQGSLMDIVDKRLHESGFDEMQVQRLLHIALWCIPEDPSIRPTAATIVQWLESDVPIIPQPPLSRASNHDHPTTAHASLLQSSASSYPPSSSSFF